MNCFGPWNRGGNDRVSLLNLGFKSYLMFLFAFLNLYHLHGKNPWLTCWSKEDKKHIEQPLSTAVRPR